MRNGKGKEYDSKGKLKIVGEYKDDILNGKVKEYNNKGKLIFDGEYKDGNKWREKADEDCDFDLVSRIGVQEYFKGEYLNGKKWNGKAKEYRDIHLGPGVANFITIVTFEGEYINGKKKGKGEKYEYKTGKRHEVIFDGENDNDDDYIYDYDYIDDIEGNYYVIESLSNTNDE